MSQRREALRPIQPQADAPFLVCSGEITKEERDHVVAIGLVGVDPDTSELYCGSTMNESAFMDALEDLGTPSPKKNTESGRKENSFLEDSFVGGETTTSSGTKDEDDSVECLAKDATFDVEAEEVDKSLFENQNNEEIPVDKEKATHGQTPMSSFVGKNTESGTMENSFMEDSFVGGETTTSSGTKDEEDSVECLAKDRTFEMVKEEVNKSVLLFENQNNEEDKENITPKQIPVISIVEKKSLRGNSSGLASSLVSSTPKEVVDSPICPPSRMGLQRLFKTPKGLLTAQNTVEEQEEVDMSLVEETSEEQTEAIVEITVDSNEETIHRQTPADVFIGRHSLRGYSTNSPGLTGLVSSTPKGVFDSPNCRPNRVGLQRLFKTPKGLPAAKTLLKEKEVDKSLVQLVESSEDQKEEKEIIVEKEAIHRQTPANVSIGRHSLRGYSANSPGLTGLVSSTPKGVFDSPNNQPNRVGLQRLFKTPKGLLATQNTVKELEELDMSLVKETSEKESDETLVTPVDSNEEAAHRQTPSNVSIGRHSLRGYSANCPGVKCLASSTPKGVLDSPNCRPNRVGIQRLFKTPKGLPTAQIVLKEKEETDKSLVESSEDQNEETPVEKEKVDKSLVESSDQNEETPVEKEKVDKALVESSEDQIEEIPVEKEEPTHGKTPVNSPVGKKSLWRYTRNSPGLINLASSTARGVFDSPDGRPNRVGLQRLFKTPKGFRAAVGQKAFKEQEEVDKSLVEYSEDQNEEIPVDKKEASFVQTPVSASPATPAKTVQRKSWIPVVAVAGGRKSVAPAAVSPKQQPRVSISRKSASFSKVPLTTPVRNARNSISTSFSIPETPCGAGTPAAMTSVAVTPSPTPRKIFPFYSPTVVKALGGSPFYVKRPLPSDVKENELRDAQAAEDSSPCLINFDGSVFAGGEGNSVFGSPFTLAGSVGTTPAAGQNKSLDLIRLDESKISAIGAADTTTSSSIFDTSRMDRGGGETTIDSIGTHDDTIDLMDRLLAQADEQEKLEEQELSKYGAVGPKVALQSPFGPATPAKTPKSASSTPLTSVPLTRPPSVLSSKRVMDLQKKKYFFTPSPTKIKRPSTATSKAQVTPGAIKRTSFMDVRAKVDSNFKGQSPAGVTMGLTSKVADYIYSTAPPSQFQRVVGPSTPSGATPSTGKRKPFVVGKATGIPRPSLPSLNSRVAQPNVGRPLTKSASRIAPSSVMTTKKPVLAAPATPKEFKKVTYTCASKLKTPNEQSFHERQLKENYTGIRHTGFRDESGNASIIQNVSVTKAFIGSRLATPKSYTMKRH